MAHDVRFTLPERPLGFVDADFAVQKDGAQFGTLKISQGGVVWLPKHGRNHRFVHWSELADFIMKDGREIKKAKKDAAPKKAVVKKAPKKVTAKRITTS
jgi:hypothetical protein